MRKIVAMIMSACLFLSLASCAKIRLELQADTTSSGNETSTNETKSDPTVSTGELPIEQMPMVAVSVPVVTTSDIASDGTVIFNYTFQNISLIVPDPEVADAVIIDFLNRIDQTSDNAEAIRSAARSAYTPGAAWNPYLCQITYDPMRIDNGILSMFGSYASYSGTPHPETSYVSVSYDLVTGEVLDLSDILTEGTTVDTLYQSVLDSLYKQAEEKFLYDGFENTVKDRFSKTTSYDTSWYFSQNGLCFYFSPYEIAPYSSGVIIAEIPYAQLTGIVDDAYFPAEMQQVSGFILAELFDENKLDHYTQFAEVILEKGSEKVLLYTDKSLYNVRLETGSWSFDGDTFTPEHVVFAAYSLTPGDAIMVEAPLPEILPTMRLRYTTGDDTVSCYITQSGKDGSIQLTEN